MNKSITRLGHRRRLLVRYLFFHLILVLRSLVADRRWDRTVAHFHGLPHPLNLAFHSYDQHLVASNDTDIITSVIDCLYFFWSLT